MQQARYLQHLTTESQRYSLQGSVRLKNVNMDAYQIKRQKSPANGATIPAMRPRQDSIPLALPRYVVSNSSGAEA